MDFVFLRSILLLSTCVGLLFIYKMNSGSYTISKTRVKYPYTAYPSQLGMMDRVIKTLNTSQNCLIESPTGSGKSLALLCAVLAWREKEYEDAEQKVTDREAGAKRSVPSTPTSSVVVTKSPEDDVIDLTEDDNFSDCGDECRFVDTKKSPTTSSRDSTPKERGPAETNETSDRPPLTEDEIRDKVWEERKSIPKIYFGTRTHKQLSQIVRELKKTEYANVKMTILASRDQTCLNTYVRSQPDRNEACRQILNPNVHHLRTGTCTFHAKWKRQFQKPYLLRGAIRREQHHYADLVDSTCNVYDIEDIVEVGQKHGFCPYYAVSNTLLTDAELVLCPYNYIIDPVVRKSVSLDLAGQIIVLDEAHNIEDSCREAASFVFSKSELEETAESFKWDADLTSPGVVKAAKYLEGTCRKMVKWLDEQTKGEMTMQSHVLRCREWESQQFLEVLAKLELTPDAEAKIKEAIEAISDFEENEHGENGKRGNDRRCVELNTIPTASIKAMERLGFFIAYFYKADPMDYKICLKEERLSEKGTKISHGASSTNSVTLHMWCMNPAVAFTDVGTVAKSVILASGTLAPMTTFGVELGVDFKFQLEATHVLPKDRMFVASVGQGPSGRKLRVTYQNTSEWAFQDELGQLVLDICTIVPYGVLCFFPSYKLLENLHGRWMATGMLDRIAGKKVIITEPKTSGQLRQAMKEFYDAVQNPSLSGPTCTGALFMAVCRGKVSEGLDFADDNARAVITIGIPFPNVNCLEVTHKRKYNDGRVFQGKTTLNGDQWYEIQAYRALNQALGRCLRHRRDWGALILVDERFSGRDSQRYCSNLSRWIRENLKHYNDFGKIRADLSEFTQRLLSSEVGSGDRSESVDYSPSSASFSISPGWK